MADNETDGSKGSSRQNAFNKRRREPRLIDATATEISPQAAVPEGEALPLTEASAASAPSSATMPEGDPNLPGTDEPVLFGQVLRGSAAASRPATPVGDATPNNDAAPDGVAPPERGPTASSPEDGTETAAAPGSDPSSMPRTGEGPSGAYSGLFGDPSVSLAEAAADPPPPPPRRRSSLGLTIGAIAAVLLLIAVGLFFVTPERGAMADLRTALAASNARIDALEARPDPGPLGARMAGLDERTSTVERSLAAVAKTAETLDGRVSALAAPSPPPGEPGGDAAAAAPPVSPPVGVAVSAATPADLSALGSRIDDLAHKVDNAPSAAPAVDLAPLQAKLADLAQRLDNLQAGVAALPKIDLGPLNTEVGDLDRRIGDVDRGVAALSGTVAALPKVDLTPLQAAIAANQHRLAPLEAALSMPKAGDRTTEARAVGSADVSRAAPLAVVAEAAGRGIDEGRPIEAEVDALRSLGVDDAVLAPLGAVAAKGAATLSALKTQWDEVEPDVLAATRPASGSLLDRLKAGARQIVSVRRVGAPAGEDPGSVTARIAAALEAGDVPAALAAWDNLPEAGRAVSRAWDDAARARIDARAAARSLSSGAIETLAKAKG